ncbi:MAG TPA: FkbM family methyltransferase, partial [Bacteroidia bacterium]|nr:FkbM family methyltransferase [Bacteroidia bacterium]
KESVNYYTDNLDYYSFGTKRPFKKAVINQLKRLFFNKPVLSIVLSNDFLYGKFFLGFLFKYTKYIEPLEYFYKTLETEESKELLLKLMAFRLLGYVKVKLPLSSPKFWEGIKEVEKLKNENDFVEVKSFPWKVYLHNIEKLGFPQKVYINSKGAYTTYVLQQYVKKVDGKNLGPEKDDVALDLGGCYGDTSVFFSDLVGKGGKVYAFEFIPGNLNVFRKNLALNDLGKDSVEIVERPVWETSDKKIYYSDAGAASHVSFEKFEGYEGEALTITIDDFVEKYNIQKLDFIKTDIEGAEPYALRGAIKTLTRFKPKLAISIYHGMGDFTDIIRQVNELGLGYKFYLGHYTIYASETVLYCKVDK